MRSSGSYAPSLVAQTPLINGASALVLLLLPFLLVRIHRRKTTTMSVSTLLPISTSPTSPTSPDPTLVDLSHDSRGPPRPVSKLGQVRIAIREELAEFIGTFVFMLLGFGASAQATVGAGNAIEAYISWGFGLSIGLWYAAGISGGHLNPSVTIASAVYTKFPWKKVPRYIFAQLLGGVTSALVIYAVYFPLIQAYASGSLATPTPGGSADTTIVHPTAGIFSSFPSPGVSTGSAVVATLVASGVFVGSILAFINGDNQGSPKTHVPIAIGILLMLVGMSLGAPAGGAVNPAADLGGRIAMAMVGYGGKVFSAYDAYFWIPIVIGPVGAVIGTGIQRACLQVDEIRLERIDQK